MIIKRLRISGFKHIKDTEWVEFKFYPYTMVSGENFTGKTTICEALCWGFCGCNINGNVIYDSLLMNYQSSMMEVEIEFVDNKGDNHILKRSKQKSVTIELDRKVVNQNVIFEYIGDKNVFMNTFVVGNFLKLSPKEARELLMQILPQINHNEILEKIPADMQGYLPENQILRSNDYLKSLKARIKKLESDEIHLKGQLKAFSENAQAKGIAIVDESAVLSRIEELEKKKEHLIKVQVFVKDISVLYEKRDLLRKEYNLLKSKLLKIAFSSGDTCPTCRQKITEECIEHLDNYISQANKEILTQVNEIIKQGKELNSTIENEENKFGYEVPDQKNVADELENITVELKKLRLQHEDILKNNAKATAHADFADKSKSSLQDINKKIAELKEEIAELKKAIEAAAFCNSIKTELQFQNISKYLNRVSIRLEKVVKSTGEVKDCFEVLYDDKELMLLSNSERVRVGLEISNLINNKTGLKIPLFLDNAESITHYEKPDAQVIEAVVARKMPLTVEDGRSMSNQLVI